MRYLRLLLLYARVSVQNDAAYRLDFLLKSLVAVVHLLSELLVLWIVFNNTRSLNGWGVWETLALLGVYRVIVGVIGMVVAPNMRQTMDDIRQGGLDYVLLKPLDSQFQVSVRKLVVWRLTDVALGLGLACTAAARLLGTLPPAKLGLFFVMLTVATSIVYSIWLIIATSAVWFTRIANIEMVFWNVFEVGRFPVAVYPPWLRWMLTFVLPMAFVTTFPAQALFGALPRAVWLAGAVFAPALLVAAALFWRFGLRRYSGASA